MDINYRVLLSDPMSACKAVFDKLGLTFTESDEQAFQAHLDSNRRDDRPPHKHNLADYDTTIEQISESFAFYTETFRDVFEEA
jgi:hypothetical protein